MTGRIHISLVIGSILLCSLVPIKIIAQKDSIQVFEAFVVEGDTIPLISLGTFSYSEHPYRNTKKYTRRYRKLRKKVVKTYPYATVTHELLANYDEELSRLTAERDRKDYLNIAEDELKAEFEGEIRSLTVSEGKILIKLIDRETGDTSFDLIKKLKGGFTAFMYQSIARIFGSNLKSEYDPLGDDMIIEDIVVQIEQGEIYVPPKQAVTTKARERLKRKERRMERRQKKRQESMASSN